MKKIVLVILQVLFVWGVFGQTNIEPYFAGRPESYWLNALTNADSSQVYPLFQYDLGAERSALLLKAINLPDNDKRYGSGAMETIRTNAAILLMQKLDNESLLEFATNHFDPNVRALAMLCFHADTNETVTTVMISGLTNVHAQIRYAAVMGLTLSNPKRTMAQTAMLAERLLDEDLEVRIMAARLLNTAQYTGNLTSPEAEAALPVIENARFSSNAAVSNAAVHAVADGLRIAIVFPRATNVTYRSLATGPLPKLNSGMLVDSYLKELLVQWDETNGTPWSAFIQVVDSGKKPVEDANIAVQFYRMDGRSTDDGRYPVEETFYGRTDRDGIFLASHRDTGSRIDIVASKYGLIQQHKFRFSESQPNDSPGKHKPKFQIHACFDEIDGKRFGLKSHVIKRR